MEQNTTPTTDIKSEVQTHYAGIARRASLSSCGCGSASASAACCGPESDAGVIPPLVDYAETGTEAVAGANLGLGCGVPTLFAGIRPGDTVLDLGSGAGVDVFLAAGAVGPTGHVIGVDLTPEMIALAWENAIRAGHTNVEFRQGDIEALPVADASVDVVISNCVINLAPDKARVFGELARVMRAGGRFSISDVVSYGEIPAEVLQNVEAWVGCVAGALPEATYLDLIRQAGFVDVVVDRRTEYDYFDDKNYGFASITVEGRKP